MLSKVFMPISIVEAHPVVASGIDKLVTGCTLKIDRLIESSVLLGSIFKSRKSPEEGRCGDGASGKQCLWSWRAVMMRIR